MQWSADTTPGDWIAGRLESGWATMHHFVPCGFPAYTRIFHSVTRERPVGRAWPPHPADKHRREWERFAADAPEIDVEDATWGEAARAFGTRMHGLAQWDGITRATEHEGGEPVDAAGWRWSEPAQGRLDAASVAAALEDLLPATASREVFAAVWEGWGGMLGGLADRPTRISLSATERLDADLAAHHGAMLSRSFLDVFDRGFRQPTWHPGILSDEVSRGDRLRLPDRAHVLFRGAGALLADRTWTQHVPWARPDDAFAPSPSLVWPLDRAWVLVTEVDFDSTVVASSVAAAAALAADPRLETAPLAPGADLSWDADEVNR